MKAFATQRIISALTTPKNRLQLLKITKLPERTLRYNIAILKKEKKIVETPVFADLRTKLFSLVPKGENND